MSRGLLGLFGLVYGGKQALITVPLTLVGLYIGWMSLVYAWNYNYSTGDAHGHRP